MALKAKIDHWLDWCFNDSAGLYINKRYVQINPVYQQLIESEARTNRRFVMGVDGKFVEESSGTAMEIDKQLGSHMVLGLVACFGVNIATRVIDFVSPVPKRCVKAKGVIMGYAENSRKVQFESMKQLVLNQDTVIDGLKDAPLKRVKINATTTQIRNSNQTKAIRFTATKRLPAKLEFQHLYEPGFRLPLGHIHCCEA